MDFSSPISNLVSPDIISGFYDAMQQDFPICHFGFVTAASSIKNWIAPDTMQCEEDDDMQCDEDEAADDKETLGILDRKRRRVLALFLGLLLTRSQRLLPFYSIVEPLGL